MGDLGVFPSGKREFLSNTSYLIIYKNNPRSLSRKWLLSQKRHGQTFRRIFNCLSTGMSVCAVAQKLREIYVFSPSGKREFLSNKSYFILK